MLPVTGYKDFLQKFNRVRDKRRVYVFVLFDNRPSQQAVRNFSSANFSWLNQLAVAAKVFGFVFLYEDYRTDEIVNPSLQVASLFGIQPNHLPGILIFDMLDENVRDNSGIYLPLNDELFSASIKTVETVFADLFSIIQKAQRETDDSRKLLTLIAEGVSGIERRETVRPIADFLKDKLIKPIWKFPNKFMETVAEAFGKEAASKVLGGGTN